jgi:hypothetical protein
MAAITDGQRAVVQRLIGDAFDADARIASCERIDPWFVYRVHLEGAAPASVIVKSLREHPTGFRTDPAQVATERAALEFMADHVPGRAPRLIASDLDACVLVLEDLAPRIPLWDLLRTNADGADEGLRSFADALGDTAALTHGLEDAYSRRRRELGPFDPLAARTMTIGWGWDETRDACESIGAAPSTAAERDIAAAFGRLREPGPFLAFSNGDAGANNYLVHGSDGRRIDWEFAGFRHALCDAVCLYVPGSMWMTVGDPIAEGHEDVYRAALSAGIDRATDDAAFGLGLASACIGFAAVERLSRLPKLDARAPGHESRVQMIVTLEAAARATEAHRGFPDAAGWLRSVAVALRKRWPDADVDVASLGRYATRE